jgi:hypothetical protein
MNYSETDRDKRSSRRVGESVSHGRMKDFILADGIRVSITVLESFQDLPVFSPIEVA